MSYPIIDLKSRTQEQLQDDYLFIVKHFKLNKKRQYLLRHVMNCDWIKKLSLDPKIFFETLYRTESRVNYPARYEFSSRGIQHKHYIKPSKIQRYKTSQVPISKFKVGEMVGIEIECFIPLTDKMKMAVLELYNENRDEDDQFDKYDHIDKDDAGEYFRPWLQRYFNSINMHYVDVKYDSSIDVDDYDEQLPVELTLCLVKSDHYSRLRKLINVLNELKAKVNKTCGLHIHLDMRNKTSNQITIETKRLYSALPVLKKLVPKSRWVNADDSYCRINSKFSMTNDDKYQAINTSALQRHNTIEIRLHSGTTNFTKIKNWIDLLWTIKSYDGPNASLLTRRNVCNNPVIWFFDNIGLKSDLQRYFLQREALFMSTEETRQEIRVGNTHNFTMFNNDNIVQPTAISATRGQWYINTSTGTLLDTEEWDEFTEDIDQLANIG